MRILLLPSQTTVSAVAISLPLMAWPLAAKAQEVNLNYESFSSLEEPLATEVGDVTLLLTGLADTPLWYNFEGGEENWDAGFLGNFQVSAETQLPNRWNVGIAYFGQYETELDDNYSDNVAGFVSGAWGTLLGGNVSEAVHEQTRRLRGVGNAALAFDDNLGALEEWSGGYIGRFGPTTLSAIVDEESNFDIGASFQRPIGNKDYRLSVRYADSLYTSADDLIEFESKAVTSAAELTYGSSVFDLGLGYEEFSSHLTDQEIDRWFTSAGMRTKKGVWSVSLEGHYGEIDGNEEYAAALGVQYDIARGLSANFGYNYQEADVSYDDFIFIDEEESQAVVSLRYSF